MSCGAAERWCLLTGRCAAQHRGTLRRTLAGGPALLLVLSQPLSHGDLVEPALVEVVDCALVGEWWRLSFRVWGPGARSPFSEPLRHTLRQRETPRGDPALVASAELVPLRLLPSRPQLRWETLACHCATKQASKQARGKAQHAVTSPADPCRIPEQNTQASTNAVCLPERCSFPPLPRCLGGSMRRRRGWGREHITLPALPPSPMARHSRGSEDPCTWEHTLG